MSVSYRAAFSADVSKEGAGKNRKVEFDMEDYEKDPDDTLPDDHLHKLSGIGHDRRREHNWCGHRDEPFTECHIFQNQLIGKASDLLKQWATDEKSLIVGNDATASQRRLSRNEINLRRQSLPEN